MINAIVASIIVLITLFFILTEKMNRAITAMAGGAVMLIVGMYMGFYNEDLALEAIEWEALGLLLGMMILVSILVPTGFFQYAAVKASQLSKGDPWRLVLLLGAGTALVSLFFNNITTVVLVGPITILVTELIGISPIPILMAQALLSDTADVGTSVGDPASVLVASASGNSFTDFLTHSMPIVLVAAAATLLMLRLLFADELRKKPSDPDLVAKLNAQETLKDRTTTRRVMIVLALTILLFIFQGRLNLSSAFIAIMAATIALVWTQPDLTEVLERVDWHILIFFIGLFVLVGGLSASGAFEPITQFLAQFATKNPILLGVLIIWIVAALSALVDNVPVTIAMISLLQGLQHSGVDVTALWWAVVFRAGFGGNATSIGSGANIVIVSLSEKTKTPITPKMWSRKGLPVAIVTCIVGSILFVLAYGWLSQ
ncbi:SLC13 family permease [Chloroflexota bacterium]